jgi:hypothetical protein
MALKVATKTDWNKLPAAYVQKPAATSTTNRKTAPVAILGSVLAASAYYFLPSKLIQEKEKQLKEYADGLRISIEFKAARDALAQKEQELLKNNQTFESKASSVKALQLLNVQIIEMRDKIAPAPNKIREQEALVQKTQQELDSLLEQEKQLKQEVSALRAEERGLEEAIGSDKLSPQAQVFFAEQSKKREELKTA